jgi:hypothetical protein
MVISNANVAKNRLGFARGVLLKNATAQMARFPNEREEARGHTEGLSKWKGCRIFMGSLNGKCCLARNTRNRTLV